MDLKLYPGRLTGSVSVIPSKSHAHRLLICAALADAPTSLFCRNTSRDIEATAACLQALGAEITRTQEGYTVKPVENIPDTAVLPCRDSGSTLRFLLPVVGALGIDTIFQMVGRLSKRPLFPLWEEMERMGCQLSWLGPDRLHCTGKLNPGEYRIPGDVSSQFISGLLFAGAMIPGQTKITVTGTLESRPYVDMTCHALETFGCPVAGLSVTGSERLISPGEVTVEGDWSNGSFFLGANILGSEIQIENLSDTSLQGDQASTVLLPRLKAGSCTISAADIPDLVPVLAVVAACCHGAVFTDIRRLRLKESDRVSSVTDMINALGGRAEAADTALTIYGTGLTGGIVDCRNDHRIAMSAAVAATVCREPVILQGAECVAKSYPEFFDIYRRLGGKYEQYLR